MTIQWFLFRILNELLRLAHAMLESAFSEIIRLGLAMIHQVRERLLELRASFLFSAELYIIPGLVGTAFTGNAFGKSCSRSESPLRSVMVEGYFQLQHNSYTLPAKLRRWCFVNLGKLNSCVGTSCPVPEFSRTVCELVDVLVEFVFPSESGVTYLSDLQQMTTHHSIFNLQRIYSRSRCRTFRIVDISCTCVLYRLSRYPFFQQHRRFRQKCLPHLFLKLHPHSFNSGRPWVARRSRVASARSRVTCCTNIVTSLRDTLRSKSGSP